MRRSTFRGLPFEDAETGIVSALDLPGGTMSMELDNDLLAVAQRPATAHLIRDTTEPTLLVRFRPDAEPTYFFEHCDPTKRPATSLINIGKCSQRTVAEARQTALNHAIRAQRGEDVRTPKSPRRGFTVAEAVRSYERALQEHHGLLSAWQIRKLLLLNAHLVPAIGDQSLAAISRTEWLDPIERVTLRQKSTGAHLLKATKALLNHALDIGALDASPLARAKPLAPHAPAPKQLSEVELAKVMIAAEAIGEPWSTIIGLVIATGESAEDVRQIQREHLDFAYADWFRYHLADQGLIGDADYLSVPLNCVAMALLAPYEGRTGFLFPSRDPRRPDQPIHMRAEIGMRVSARMHFSRRIFTIRSLRRAVRFHAFGNREPSAEAMMAWGIRLQAILRDLKCEGVVL